MFNEDYYRDKGDEIIKKFNSNKDVLIQDITNTLQRFLNDQKDLQDRYDELMKQKEEYLNKKAEAEKKKIDDKIKRGK